MSEDAPKARRIRYHLGSDGAPAPRSQDADNPLSQNFVPLTERDERGRSRWWALHGKRFGRASSGEYDG